MSENICNAIDRVADALKEQTEVMRQALGVAKQQDEVCELIQTRNQLKRLVKAADNAIQLRQNFGEELKLQIITSKELLNYET